MAMFQSAKKFFEEKVAALGKEAEEREASKKASAANPYLDLKTAPISLEAVGLISEETARAAKAAAIEERKGKIALAVLDPADKKTESLITDLKGKGYSVSVFTASLSGLSYVWELYKFVPKERGKISGEINIESEKLVALKQKLSSIKDVETELRQMSLDGSYTGELLEAIMAGALASDASDIHLEPAEENIKLRYRIDGSLRDVSSVINKNAYLFILSRIKLLSGLKINVHDEAQDGRFAIKFDSKEVDIRVAVAPSAFGEVAVMRLLDPKNIDISMSDLGLREDDLAIVTSELKEPNGMILNTGPTGSGKTTTLYTFLRHKNSPEIKIITIEDPIEYHLAGIEQTQVDKEAGYTFASGLSSLMRQDPDVILVGEIRDKETAEIAIQAALTGHLVFSTVHANEAAGAIPRLLDLGVRPSSIGPALNLVIAQRLVRKLCPFCKKAAEISEEEKARYVAFLNKLPSRVKKDVAIGVYEPVGCEKCNGFGYKGRVGIFELFSVGAEAEDMINKEIGEADLYAFAVKQGMVTLEQDGVYKVITGQTSFSEIEAATGPINWKNYEESETGKGQR